MSKILIACAACQRWMKAVFLLLLLPLAGWSQATFTWTGASGTDWNTPANWVQVGADADGIPDANDNVVFDGGNSCTLTASVACNNLTFATTYTGTLSLGTHTLEVYGSWTDATPVNVFQANTGTVIFRDGGSGPYTMTISASYAGYFHTLIFDKGSSSMSIGGAFAGVQMVSNELIMESGTLTASGTGYLPVANLRVRAGNSAFSSIAGRIMQVVGNTVVESGSFTLNAPARLEIQGNYTQNGGYIVGSNDTDPTTAPVRFLGGAATSVVSGTAIEIRAAVAIHKTVRWNSAVTIGEVTAQKNLIIGNGGVLDIQTTSPHLINGSVMYSAGNGIIQASASPTVLNILQNWDSSQSTAANPLTRPIGDSQVYFIGSTTNCTINVSANTVFDYLLINKTDAYRIVSNIGSNPLRINKNFHILSGTFRAQNVTDATNTISILASVVHSLNRDNSSGGAIDISTDPISALIPGAATGETVSYPAGDIIVQEDVIIEDDACLDLGTNEPGNTETNRTNFLTIALYVGKNLDDKNNTLPSNAQSIPGTSYPVNPGPPRGLYLGLSTAYPMGGRQSCSGGGIVNYQAGRAPRENYQIPTIVFFGGNAATITGNVPQLPDLCNNLNGGRGLSLPNVYIVKNTDATTVTMSNNLRIHGNVKILQGTFTTNGYTLYYGDYAAKGVEGNTGISYNNLMSNYYSRDDVIDVYGQFILTAGSRLFMNTGGEERGSFLRVRKGGFFRALGTAASPATVTREGTPRQYYRICVYNGGAIEAIHTEFTFLSAASDSRYGSYPWGPWSGWSTAQNWLGDNSITQSPNYDLPSWEYEGGPGSGHGWQESRGGLKVMMGAIVNPLGNTSPDPRWLNVPHNFSYCSFGSGGASAACLTINTGQALDIYNASFSANSGSFSKNVVANARYYFNSSLTGDPAADVIGFGNLQMNVITMKSSSGAIGGSLGEQYDGGLNDDNVNPFYDQIVWENYVKIYWVGNSWGTGGPNPKRQTNGEGPGSVNPSVGPTTINEGHSGDPTEWTNPKNWSLRNDEYYNPFQIYPGQTTLPNGLPKKNKPTVWVGNDPAGEIPADTLKMFDVMITRTASSNPTVNADIEVYGAVVVNAGVLRDGRRIYDARDASASGTARIFGEMLAREDLSPSVNRGRDAGTGTNKVLTVPAGRVLTVGGDMRVRANGQLVLDANAEVRIGTNLLALDNLASWNENISPPEYHCSTNDDRNSYVTTGSLATMPNIVMDATSTLVFNGVGGQQVRVRRNELQNVRLDKSGGVVRIQGLTFSERARLHILGDLTINGGEFRMLSTTPLLVKGNVTLNGGRFTFNDSPVTVRGNWINNGGQIDPGTGRINFHPNSTAKRIIKTNGEPFPAVYIGFFTDYTEVNCYMKDADPDDYPAGHPIRSSKVTSMVEYEVQDELVALGHTTVMANRTLSTLPGANVKLRLAGVRVENGGILDLNPGAELLMDPNPAYPFYVDKRNNIWPSPIQADNPTRTLLIEEGGYLEALGTASQYVKISRQGTSDYYRFLVEGEITARYFLFEFMDERGVDLSGTLSGDGAGEPGSGILGSTSSAGRGASIDPAASIGSFSDGIFTNGKQAANAVYLNLPRVYSTSDIYRTNFALPISGGYNVRRSPSSCASNQVIFRLATGAFRGEAYDDDRDVGGCFGGDGNVRWIENIKQWDGRSNAGVPTTDNLWSNPQNWEGDVLPLPTEEVVIDYTAPNLDPAYASGSRPFVVEVTSGTAQCASLTINATNDPNGAIDDIYLRLNGGNLQVTGDLSVQQNSHIEVLNASNTITVGGSWSVQGSFVHGNGTVIFDGGSGSRVINGGANHAPGTYGIFNNPFYNVEFRSGISELNSTLFVENNLTIAAGATLDASIANNRIDIQGNWVDNGTFVPRQGEVVFSGNKPQTLTKTGGAGYETFWKLIMAKEDVTSAGAFTPSTTDLTINSRVVIGPITGTVLGGELYLMNGKIISSTGSELIISEKAQWRRDPAAPLTSAFVEGPAGRIFSSNTSYVRLSFPIGKGSYPGTATDGVALNMQLDKQVPTTFTVEQFNANPEDWTPANVRGIYPATSRINMISQDRYWVVKNIEFPNTSANAADMQSASLELPFRGDDERSNFPIVVNGNTYLVSAANNLSLLEDIHLLQDFDNYELSQGLASRGAPSAALDRQVRRGQVPNEGGLWKDLGGLPSLSNANTQIVSGNITTLGNGQVTFGWYFIPLPVEILNLEAKPVEGRVQLSWVTVYEQDNAGFTVERSLDTKQIEEIGWVEAKGPEGSTVTAYEYWDNYPPQGVVYYRLRQKDKSGHISYSKWVAVEVKQTNHYEVGKVSLYPNPARDGQSFYLELPYGVELHEWQVVDMKGNIIAGQSSVSSSMATLKIDLKRRLPEGVYVVRLRTQTGWQFIRWVVL